MIQIGADTPLWKLIFYVLDLKNTKLNQLFVKYNDEIETKTIEEISSYRRGSFPQPYTNRNFYGGKNSKPFIQVADIDDNFLLNDVTKQTISTLAQPKSIFVKKGTVICSIQGSIGRVAITQYDSYVDRTIAIFEKINSNVNKRYFSYVINEKFLKEKENARGTTLKTITKEEFSKFEVTIPPLPVQEEIVKTLDTFHQYINDKIFGLKREIELRQIQYEYYRNKLLSF